MKNRIVFFGYSKMIDAALQTLDKLQVPYLIICNSAQSSRFASFINSANILIAEKISELPQRWSEGDLGISVGAPWIFSRQVIEKFPKDRLINLHGSQLPMFRGGNLFSWFVLNRVRVGVCALHHLTAGIDEGDVVCYEEFLYPGHCRKPADYIEIYESRNADFLAKFLKNFLEGQQPLSKHKQPEYLSSYLPRLSSDLNSWVDWSWSGADLESFISAFDEPYAGAKTVWRSKVVTIKDVYFQPAVNYHPFQHGIVIRKNSRWINVAVHGGELIITSITDSGATSLMEHLKVGDRMITTANLLDAGKQRAIKKGKNFNYQSDAL